MMPEQVARPRLRSFGIDSFDSTGCSESTSSSKQATQRFDPPPCSSPHMTSSHQRSANQQNSHLLRLPQELLDEVIAYVVHSITDPDVGEAYTHPPLLHTCHHLRESTAPIYYSLKPIVFNKQVDLQNIEKIFNGFDPAHKTYIKRVVCVWYFESYGSRLKAKDSARRLDAATGLRTGTWAFGCLSESDRSMVDYINARGKRCGVRDRWLRTQRLLMPKQSSHLE